MSNKKIAFTATEGDQMNWNGWSLDRVVVIAMGVFFLVIFVQVTLYHYRQNFRHWSMWIPVTAAPLFGLALILYAFYRPDWLLSTLTFLLSVGVAAGAFGSYMHVKGVGEREIGRASCRERV